MSHNVPWMSIGAVVLLIARLIQDVPPAYEKLKAWVNRKASQDGESN